MNAKEKYKQILNKFPFITLSFQDCKKFTDKQWKAVRNTTDESLSMHLYELERLVKFQKQEEKYKRHQYFLKKELGM